MIPALFPFMVLSGVMIRLNLTENFVKLLKPFLQPLFHVSDNCLYVIFTGFLCGFPMGAVVVSQLYERKRLTEKEAEYLLSFCNNIGPVYFLTYALPTMGVTRVFPCLFGMYGIPLLYGLFLRYFPYGKVLQQKSLSGENTASNVSFLQALDESVTASLTGITKLGGYMILFQMLNVLPGICMQEQDDRRSVLSALFEITGGIQSLGTGAPVLSLCLLVFGGFCCMAQTAGYLRSVKLSLKKYMGHKLILTFLSALYYVFFFPQGV
jgi:hypothetical protein